MILVRILMKEISKNKLKFFRIFTDGTTFTLRIPISRKDVRLIYSIEFFGSDQLENIKKFRSEQFFGNFSQPCSGTPKIHFFSLRALVKTTALPGKKL